MTVSLLLPVNRTRLNTHRICQKNEPRPTHLLVIISGVEKSHVVAAPHPFSSDSSVAKPSSPGPARESQPNP